MFVVWLFVPYDMLPAKPYSVMVVIVYEGLESSRDQNCQLYIILWLPLTFEISADEDKLNLM